MTDSPIPHSYSSGAVDGPRFAAEHDPAGVAAKQAWKLLVVDEEEVCVVTRMVCLIDVSDPLLSRRAHRDAWSEERTLAFIASERGSVFDPAMVDILLREKDTFLAIRQRYPDDLDGVAS